MAWALWRCGGSKAIMRSGWLSGNFNFLQRGSRNHLFPGLNWNASLGGRMSANVIRRAARVLNPDRPITALALLTRAPRSTVKSWATGHRRPPIVTLEILRDLLKNRQAALFKLIPELEQVISQREREPKHASGFMIRDPLTGKDKRNRRGRPRRME
jgi:hypothetical protein